MPEQMKSSTPRTELVNKLNLGEEPLGEHAKFLLELSPDQFQEWRHHPVTRAFLLLLKDRSLNYHRMALDDWANDVRDVEGEDPQALRSRALRGRVAELESLRELTIPDIRRFYGQEDEASNEGN